MDINNTGFAVYGCVLLSHFIMVCDSITTEVAPTWHGITFLAEEAHHEMHVKRIMDAMVQVGVLDMWQAKCYTLTKITKRASPNAGEQELDIILHLQETDQTSSQSVDIPCKPEHDDDNPATITPLLSTEPAVPDYQLQNHSKNASREGQWVQGSSIKNRTQKKPDDVPHIVEGGLSGTQILVIATCSTVIGLFFIVALLMRIRNYVKRRRAEKERRRPLPPSKLQRRIPKKTNQVGKKITPKVEPTRDGEYPQTSNGEKKPMLVISSQSAPSTPSIRLKKTSQENQADLKKNVPVV